MRLRTLKRGIDVRARVKTWELHLAMVGGISRRVSATCDHRPGSRCGARRSSRL